MNSFNIIASLLSCIVTFSACGNKSICVDNDNFLTDVNINFDTTSYQIDIGNELPDQVIYSQIFVNNGTEYYTQLYNNKIYFFNLDSVKLSFTYDIQKSGKNGVGTISNYSGFYVHSLDSIFVYQYGSKTAYLLDSLSRIKKQWSILSSNLTKKVKYPPDPEAITPTAMLKTKNYLILSGSGHGQPKDATKENKPISARINLLNDSIDYVYGYPDIYRQGDFGGVYFNTIYNCIDTKRDRIIYSFPADHNLYVIDKDYTSELTFNAGSRHINTICSSSINSKDLYSDKNTRINYFLTTPSYSRIFYDESKDCFYRIALHPYRDKGEIEKGTFVKPFSIIVLDNNLKYIGESEIISENIDEYELLNMHLASKGIIIQKKNEDENKLTFKVFEYKKS